MIQLTPAEARTLGVLVEKSTTTPEQYPLSLNALTAGCNQRNNREPVMALTDDEVFDAVESLRAKGLVIRIEAGAGSRVHRFRHNATDALHVRAAELAVLAELLLRGPQTQGELRGRASRMHPMDTLDVVRDMLRALSERPEPLVRQLPPAPGSRAEQYVQLLAPDAHEVELAPTACAPGVPGEAGATAKVMATSGGLADRVAKLEAEVVQLRESLNRLATSLGESIQ
jgi:uncharacterized protein YceH (UPF0502 family)